MCIRDRRHDWTGSGCFVVAFRISKVRKRSSRCCKAKTCRRKHHCRLTAERCSVRAVSIVDADGQSDFLSISRHVSQIPRRPLSAFQADDRSAIFGEHDNHRRSGDAVVELVSCVCVVANHWVGSVVGMRGVWHSAAGKYIPVWRIVDVRNHTW